MNKTKRAIFIVLLAWLFVLGTTFPLLAQPDLIVDKARLARDIRTDLLDIVDDCYINEGCVGGTGDRQLIRFSTHIRNIGKDDFVVGQPPIDPAHQSHIWEYDECHEHWHYEGYVQYYLYDQYGTQIPVGNKNGFCLMDSECDNGEFPTYHCGYQGISAGCGDIYGWSLDCQWIDVTNVPSGIYRLENRVNHTDAPDFHGVHEVSYANNLASVCLQLSRAANGKHLVRILPDEQCNCEDQDQDGVCSIQDCDDRNPARPAIPNTPCNDFNPNTENDRIQSDGCTCQGILLACADVDQDGVCAAEDCDDNNPAVPARPGTLCNDGNPITFLDFYLQDGCTCFGLFPICVDRDRDGFCKDGDCDDTNSAIPAPIGSRCNDGNPSTFNDVIQKDGCTCQGQIPQQESDPCTAIDLQTTSNAIIVNGLNAPFEIVKLYRVNSNWILQNQCFATCSDSHSFSNLAAGAYVLTIQLYDADWNKLCVKQLEVVIGSSYKTETLK